MVPHADTSQRAPVELPAEKMAFLQSNMQKKLAKKDRHGQPRQAHEFYVFKRAEPGRSHLPSQRYRTAKAHMRNMPRHSVQLSGTTRAEEGAEASFVGDLEWQSLGPGNVGGRTRALVIDTNAPDVMYAGGVAGGVWKTTDSGASWAPLTDNLANLAVTSLVLDPTASQIVYAGTGEGFFNGDAVRGDGIFRSSDGGASWQHLAVTSGNADFHYVNDLVVSSNDPTRVYAATRTGVWRSTDSGQTWVQSMSTTYDAGCLDLEIRTDIAPDLLIAACGSFQGSQVYRSVDGGSSWQAVINQPDTGRTTLAIAPSDQDIMYALITSLGPGTENQAMHSVMRSNDGGANWQARVTAQDPDKINTVLLSNPIYAFYMECFGSMSQFFNQGWYDNVIAVDPADPDIVWAGGVDLFRSDDGGANWDLTSYWWADKGQPNFVHADQHRIVFHPQYDGLLNQTMFVGNDGGVFRTDNARDATVGGLPNLCSTTFNGGVTWTNLNNGYGVTQFYHGVGIPDDTSYRYLGGTQDNGTILDNDNGNPDDWADILGGDGGYVAVDPSNLNVLFGEFTRLSLQKSTDGGNNFSSATNGISESSSNFLFIAPFAMAEADPDVLWIGGRRLWRTTNQAGNWTAASDTLTPASGSVSAIAISPNDLDRVVVGTTDGYVFRSSGAMSTNGATTWSSVALTSGYISSLAFDPSDDRTAYATVSTFGTDHVWRSTNGAGSWTPIDQVGLPQGIPDLPAHSIAVHPQNPQNLLVGTDLGIFATDDGGSTWAVETMGFANTPVERVHIVSGPGATLTFFAFTHGRGAYGTTVPGPCEPATCDDGTFCNGTESCGNLACLTGPAPFDDGVACTVDVCDEPSQTGSNTPDDTFCDDTFFCNGIETCDPLLDCQAGVPPVVDDGVACTVDLCNDVTDSVMNVPNDALCDDGAFCNGAETCDGANGCLAGTAPTVDDGVACTIDSCDEAGDMVVNAPDHTVCDDGVFCNGPELCDGALGCQVAVPPMVDDGISCTVDSCDEVGDVIVHAPNDAVCDDGLFCNGIESCSLTADCEAGPPPPLDDGVACTIDTCDEQGDVIVNTPDDALCDDGLFCNGAESCNPTADCEAGTPPTVDDGVDCTVDSCDEDGDVVVNAPDDALCDDNDACTADSCHASEGCQFVAIEGCCQQNSECDDGDPCTDDMCAGNSCAHVPNGSCPQDGGGCGCKAGGDPSSFALIFLVAFALRRRRVTIRA